MSNAHAAYEICEDILADADENEYAKTYAQAALDGQMTDNALDVQMNYVASNATPEYKQRIAQWQGVSTTDGFTFGYCQICGTRNASHAYHGSDADASGLVCIGCYEDFGSPDACDKCGTVTYDGDEFISGELEGNFYCNSCLMTV
jgi:hypothetical protein